MLYREIVSVSEFSLNETFIFHFQIVRGYTSVKCALESSRSAIETPPEILDLPVNCLSGSGGTERHGNLTVSRSYNQSKCLKRCATDNDVC